MVGMTKLAMMVFPTMSNVSCLLKWLQDLDHILHDVAMVCSDDGRVKLSCRYSKYRAKKN